MSKLNAVTITLLLLMAPSARADLRLLAEVGANQGLIAGGIAGEFESARWQRHLA